MASSRAATQKSASRVFDWRQDSTYLEYQSMTATRYMKPWAHGNINHIAAANLIGDSPWAGSAEDRDRPGFQWPWVLDRWPQCPSWASSAALVCGSHCSPQHVDTSPCGGCQRKGVLSHFSSIRRISPPAAAHRPKALVKKNTLHCKLANLDAKLLDPGINRSIPVGLAPAWKRCPPCRQQPASSIWLSCWD